MGKVSKNPILFLYTVFYTVPAWLYVCLYSEFILPKAYIVDITTLFLSITMTTDNQIKELAMHLHASIFQAISVLRALIATCF